MSRKKKKPPVPPAPEPEPTFPFNDTDVAEAVNELVHAGRNLFHDVKNREEYNKIFTSTSLVVDPLSYEITILRMLLASEMDKSEDPRPPRQRHGADIDNSKARVAAYCQMSGADLTEAQQVMLAEEMRVRDQQVRFAARKEIEKLDHQRRDPNLVVKLVNSISTCENIRSKLDSIMREDSYAFRRQQEDGYLTELLSEVLHPHLDLYWEIAKRFNELVGRRAVQTIKGKIETEMRKRGQLAEGDALA